MKKGLVLEGGAMRGMYTAGVLDIFMEKGIAFDGIMGVSAGALFGVNFLSKQPGRVIRYNKRFIRDKRYKGLGCLLREGNLFSTGFAYGKVPRELDVFDDETFKASGVPFYAVVTSYESGEPEYVEIKSVFDDMDKLRASGSMPFVSRPVDIGGKLYLDGGVSDSVPYEAMGKMGYDRLVVILTRDMEYRKKPMPALPIKLCFKRYPKFRDRLLQRHETYNHSVAELRELEKKGEIFVVRPSVPIDIGRVESDPEKLQQIYELGLRDGAAVADRLSAFLRV